MAAGRESKTRYAILGALTIEPMSGYGIKEVLGRTVAHFWNESYGQIYPTLKELLSAGLVSSRVEAGRRSPDRHVYTLTEAGRQELRQWLASPVETYQPGRNELLLKLFFGRHAAAGTNLEHLRRHREGIEGLIAQYEAIELVLEGEDDPDQPYWLITLRHGLHVARASLAWCNETIDRLSQRAKEPS